MTNSAQMRNNEWRALDNPTESIYNEIRNFDAVNAEKDWGV